MYKYVITHKMCIILQLKKEKKKKQAYKWLINSLWMSQ